MWVAATVGVLAVIVALIVVALNAFGGDDGTDVATVAVPDVVDLPLDEATRLIEDAGLRVGEVETLCRQTNSSVGHGLAYLPRPILLDLNSLHSLIRGRKLLLM